MTHPPVRRFVGPLTFAVSLAACRDPAAGGEFLPEGGFTSGDDGADDVEGSTTWGASAGEAATVGESGAVSTGAAATEGAGSSTGPMPVLSYATDVQPIWNARCFGSGCHDGDPIGVAVVSLVARNDPYTALTERTHAFSGMHYVTAGDPEQSYLFRKLLGTHDEDDLAGVGQGLRMPLTGGPLSETDLSTVRDWIDGGAMP